MILVIDDNAELLRSLTDLMSLDGHEVIGFEYAEDAIEWLDTTQTIPKLIVCDQNLGAVSGTDLLNHIRQHTKYDQTAFVLMTADHDNGKLLAQNPHQPKAIISKPFDITDVLAVIDNLT